MPDYQISARSGREIRVGQDDARVVTFEPKGWFIQDLKGEAGRHSYLMKLPAPWRGFRYRLEQDGRELASSGRPNARKRIVTWDLEMPGRKLELVAQDEHGLLHLLFEGGEERGRYSQRNFSEGDAWTHDFHTREESVGFAAFVAWLVVEGRPFRT
jgi:hypothetical protein